MSQSDSSSDNSQHAYDCFDDPLFLSTSDQPNIQLVSQEYTGDNFIHWKKDVLHALIAKNKAGFVDGSCKKPGKNDKKFQQWIRCDLMVMKWILNSISKSIKETLQYISGSKELWTEIGDRYGQPNSVEIYQLQREINDMSQGNSSLIEYYGQMKKAWENKDALDPLPLCSCNAFDSCTCQLLKKIVERESNSRLIQFLMGLNSAYDTVKTHILSLELLPPMSKTLSLRSKIERRQQVQDSAEPTPEANAYVSTRQGALYHSSQKKPRLENSNAGRSVDRCNYCHNLGHTKEECHKLRACTYCGKKGHVRDTCFKLRYGSNTKSGKYKGTNSFHGGRREAHNADVLHYDASDVDAAASDPLTDMRQSSGGFYDGSGKEVPPLNSQLFDGLVNTVMEQVLKVINEKHTAPVNFAGPFK